MTTESSLLELSNLKKYFYSNERLIDQILNRNRNFIPAVDGVSLTLETNQNIGIIGESGCGKTTLLKTIIGLHDLTEGDIAYRGSWVSEFNKSDWKEYRKNVQYIFQDPFDSLNPKMTVQEIVREPLEIHGLSDDGAVLEALKNVELLPPKRYLEKYPTHLSGGERQRVSIASALVLDPDVILADEPVSMLDVSTQASILKLLSNITNKMDNSIVYISHDLSTISQICDEIKVMYKGRFVESAPTMTFLEDPKHPYSRALLNSMPVPDPDYERPKVEITDTMGDSGGPHHGCRFRNRCPERMEICERTPSEITVGPNHWTACHLYHPDKNIESPQSELKTDEETS